MKSKNILFFHLCTILAVVLLSFGCSQVAQLEIEPAASWQQVADYAREHLPLEGRLLQKSDGFVYLKVDDAYIHRLFPMLDLQDEGFKEPPYFRSPEAPGAHISVFYADEHVRPIELGRHYTFALEDIEIVHPSPYTSYAILQVKAPELEKLRQKYGLSPKLFGHEFHITLAKKTQHRQDRRQYD